MSKLPEPTSIQVLRTIAPKTVKIKSGTEVSRIFFADTHYPANWQAFRYFEPTNSRFDHHLPNRNGQSENQNRGIMYLAVGSQAAKTCLAKVFQEKRTIDRNSKLPIYAGFGLTTDIQLLDLTGNFATTIGASTAIHSGPRARARRWAQNFYQAYPKIDGLLYCSSMNGNALSIALFERGINSIPSNPIIHRELRDSALAYFITMTAREIGYQVV